MIISTVRIASAGAKKKDEIDPYISDLNGYIIEIIKIP